MIITKLTKVIMLKVMMRLRMIIMKFAADEIAAKLLAFPFWPFVVESN